LMGTLTSWGDAKKIVFASKPLQPTNLAVIPVQTLVL
jgi:hypothetical protein